MRRFPLDAMRNRIETYLFRMFLLVMLATVLAGAAVGQGQSTSSRDAAVSRLTSITVLPLPEWRWHPDDGVLARSESPAVDDSQWPTFTVGNEWSSGPVWFRRVVEIPAAIGKYDIRGATLRLRVRIYGENPVHLTVYYDGVKIEEGNDLDPLILTRNAQPGKKVLVAVRANVPGGRTEFHFGQVEVEANGRPDPRTLLLEFLSAEAIVKTHSGNGREQALARTASALDWAALDRGDQAGFDRSLETARGALGELRPWLK